NKDIKIETNREILDFSDPEKLFDSLENLLNKSDWYIADLKNHIDNGFFDLNENPLTDHDVSETIYELEVTKVFIKGLRSAYNIITKENITEIHKIEKDVMPELWKYLDKYKHLMENEEFIKSQMADGIAGMLEEIIYFGGLITVYTDDFSNIDRLEREYAYFFSKEGMKRYPKLNGLYVTLLTTLASRKEEFSKLEEYAHKLLSLSEGSIYEPRNSIAFSLAGNLILAIRKEITNEEFTRRMKELHESYYLSLTPKLNSEIEIYLTNIYLALNNEEASYDMRRLLSPEYFDPYSIFIPEFGKLAEVNSVGDIIYIPFNLQSDYVADADIEVMEQAVQKTDETESTADLTETSTE
ncbi:MAG: hypothetical protein KAU62_00445, partial [Candidatus Heimdallarchaeota archaeon]|nr:hypothetical protein [Candidatus Heimdallarchaeota archaeon]MCK4609600.1 hypothetical protein [Candidatus Heimdallarchaeota archaeon]